MDRMFSVHGVPKVLVRNAVPVSVAREYVDPYELTPAYSFTYDEGTKKITIHESPWTVRDDEGVEVYSLLAPAAVLSLIKQLVAAFRL